MNTSIYEHTLAKKARIVLIIKKKKRAQITKFVTQFKKSKSDLRALVCEFTNRYVRPDTCRAVDCASQGPRAHRITQPVPPDMQGCQR